MRQGHGHPRARLKKLIATLQITGEPRHSRRMSASRTESFQPTGATGAFA